jgi:hypothetical protein
MSLQIQQLEGVIMNFGRIEFTKSELDKVPDEIRPILIEQLIVLDEISVLSAAAFLSCTPEAQTDKTTKAQVTQAFFFLRLLTARLHEAWQRLLKWPADAAFMDELGAEAKESREALGRTFGRHAYLFRLIRNKFAFHMEACAVSGSYAALSDTEPFTLWFTRHFFSFRNDLVTVVASKAVEEKMKSTDSTANLGSFFDVVRDSAQNMAKLLLRWTSYTLNKYTTAKAEKVTLPDGPDAFLPAIFDMELACKSRSYVIQRSGSLPA